MTDSSGTVVWSADYKPFGEATITVSTITNNLRFPGQYYDAETGNHYNYFRDYNPVVGRYIESDPLRLNFISQSKSLFVVPFFTMTPNNLHDYVYADNNPVGRTDPAGLISVGTVDRICSVLQFAAGARQNYYDIQRLDMLQDAADANARLINQIQRELNQLSFCSERSRELRELLANAQTRQIWFARQIADILRGLGMQCAY
jgi:RHS repeat-associated protein